MNIDTWINSKEELQVLSHETEMRPDWHDAECFGMECVLVKGPLNNAHCDEDEAHVILTQDIGTSAHTEPHHYAINLANLLAWASGEYK